MLPRLHSLKVDQKKMLKWAPNRSSANLSFAGGPPFGPFGLRAACGEHGAHPSFSWAAGHVLAAAQVLSLSLCGCGRQPTFPLVLRLWAAAHLSASQGGCGRVPTFPPFFSAFLGEGMPCRPGPSLADPP